MTPVVVPPDTPPPSIPGPTTAATAAKHLPNSDLVPSLDFGYSYDGMGNRLQARRGVTALTTGYTPMP